MFFWKYHPRKGRFISPQPIQRVPRPAIDNQWDTQDPGRPRVMFKRRRRYARTQRRRKPYYRMYRNPGLVALRKIQKLEKQEELKRIQSTINMDSAGTTVQALNLCDQGNENYERNGDRTVMKSLSMRLTVAATAAEADGFLCRIAVVYDRRPAGNLCAWDTVFTSANINALIINEGQNRGRFQIIADRTLSFDGTKVFEQVSGYWRFNLQADYSLNQLGTIADIAKGSLVVMMLAANNGAQIDVDGIARVMYSDN